MLERESRRAIELPDVRARFTALAIKPDGRRPADFRRLIESGVMRCAKLRRKRACDSNNV